jgi:5,10-methylenetetrahydrofolate reductase
MSVFSNALATSQFLVTSELTPPKGTDLSDLMQKADALKDHVTAFNLTESHTARMSMDPVAAAHLLLDRGIEPIVQMTSRDKNRIAIQASILGAAALGISNIVFMGGDPPANGDHPDAKPVFDLYSSQLLEAAHALNSGTDLTGHFLKGAPHLTVGAVVNPSATNLADEIENLRRKEDSGAAFFQSQAVFEPAEFERFMKRARPTKPVLAGIIPIKSVKMATYMNEKIPGIRIPQALIEEIAAAGDNSDQVARTSIDIAGRTVRALRSIARGVHIMAIGSEDKIPAILERGED